MKITAEQKKRIAFCQDEEHSSLLIDITLDKNDKENIIKIGMDTTFEKAIAKSYKIKAEDIIEHKIFITKNNNEKTIDIFLSINKNIDLIFLGRAYFDITEINNITNYVEDLFDVIYGN